VVMDLSLASAKAVPTLAAAPMIEQQAVKVWLR